MHANVANFYNTIQIYSFKCIFTKNFPVCHSQIDCNTGQIKRNIIFLIFNKHSMVMIQTVQIHSRQFFAFMFYMVIGSKEQETCILKTRSPYQ